MIQRIENFQKVRTLPAQPSADHGGTGVKFSLVGSGQDVVEGGTLRRRAADRVGVFVGDFKTALFRETAQIQRLGLRILVEGRNSDIQDRSPAAG
jgi:hypothetical protein